MSAGAGARSTLRRCWPGACGLTCAVLQVGFVVEVLLPGEPSLLRSQISELSAPGQPGAVWLRTADVLSALLVLALVPGWWRAARVSAGGLVVWAAGLAVAAVRPTACVETLHPGCDGPGGGVVPHDVHDLASLISVTGLVVCLVVAGRALLRHRDRARGRQLLVLGVVCGGLGLLEGAEDLVGASVLRGVSQRLQVVLLSVAIVLLADPWRWPRAGAAAADRAGASPPPSPNPSAR